MSLPNIPLADCLVVSHAELRPISSFVHGSDALALRQNIHNRIFQYTRSGKQIFVNLLNTRTSEYPEKLLSLPEVVWISGWIYGLEHEKQRKELCSAVSRLLQGTPLQVIEVIGGFRHACSGHKIQVLCWGKSRELPEEFRSHPKLAPYRRFSEPKDIRIFHGRNGGVDRVCVENQHLSFG